MRQRDKLKESQSARDREKRYNIVAGTCMSEVLIYDPEL